MKIPYGRQCVEAEDAQAVAKALQDDYLTTGPAVAAFEAAVAAHVGAAHGVAVANGTAALHALLAALGIGPGDEVVVPAITFVATANAVHYCGGRAVFADVEADTLLMDACSVEACLTERTRAILAVDYAGQPCDYDRLGAIASAAGVPLLADGCHALGARWAGRAVGSVAHATTFSFHPVKHLTTGEGGMVLTDDAELAERMRCFRCHGMSAKDGHFYDVLSLGFNYRITDFQCQLGLRQLARQAGWLERRRAIAGRYDAAFAELPGVTPLAVRPQAAHAYHLYVVKLEAARLGLDRDAAYAALREAGILANVHYRPVYQHTFYRETLGYGDGLCPVAERVYEEVLSLPMYPTLGEAEVARVIAAVQALGTRR